MAFGAVAVRVRVVDAHEEQPLSRRRRAGSSTLTSAEDLLHGGRGPLAPTDPHQGAHQRAHHLVEKAIALDVDREQVVRPAGPGLARELHAVERAHAVAVGRRRPRQGAEVALAEEARGRGAHRVEVERLGDVPGARRLVRAARGAREDAVAVVLPERAEPRVEALGRVLDLPDREVGGEERVEAAAEASGRERRRRCEARDLPERVDPRVGARGRDDLRLFARDLGDRPLELAHHGPRLRLDLRASEAGPVVLEGQLERAAAGGGGVVERGRGGGLGPRRWLAHACSLAAPSAPCTQVAPGKQSPFGVARCRRAQRLRSALNTSYDR